MIGLKEKLRDWLGINEMEIGIERIAEDLDGEIVAVADDVRSLEQAAENDDTADDLLKLENRVDKLEQEAVVYRKRIDVLTTCLLTGSNSPLRDLVLLGDM